MSEQYIHKSVLLNESIDALQIKPNGIYVDLTFGGGGHSKMILQYLGPEGKLFAFDQDTDVMQNNLVDPRFKLINQNFRFFHKMLRIEGIQKVDGILADLGVSSFQFDTASKGFSYRFDTELDMRMDQHNKVTAASILNTYSEEQLKEMFEKYGEVRNSKTLAKEIVKKRIQNKILKVSDFNDVLQPLSFGNMYKYAAPVYQALRIEVNDEIQVLKEMLEQCPEALNRQGRIAIITFHSLEDRLVKNFFRCGKFDGEPVKDMFGNFSWSLKGVNKKPIEVSQEELNENKRSRSAKLRIAEKIE